MKINWENGKGWENKGRSGRSWEGVKGRGKLRGEFEF